MRAMLGAVRVGRCFSSSGQGIHRHRKTRLLGIRADGLPVPQGACSAVIAVWHLRLHRGKESAMTPTTHEPDEKRGRGESDEVVSKAWLFLACVMFVVIWAPTFAFMPLDTWLLVINTVATIITFLLVALLQNTERRADDAVQQKLNAIAGGLGDLEPPRRRH
jgi:hypothetical protein